MSGSSSQGRRALSSHAALVISVFALIVAMGGTSYAAVKLGSNSVGSKQLQANAVTTSKIKASNVTATQLKSRAVTHSRLGDNSVTGSKVANGSLTSADFAASTLAEFTGATGATGAKGSTGATGPAGPGFTRTVIVSPTGASATANGTLLVNAVNGTADASATRPRLVLVESGVYDVGTTTLSVPAYVDLAGSGRNITTVAGEGSSVIEMNGAGELRDLAVVATPTSGGEYALNLKGHGDLVTDVGVTVTGASDSAAVGVALNNDSTATLTDLNVSATGGGSASFAEGLLSYVSATIVGGTYTSTAGSGDTSIAINDSGGKTLDIQDATISAGSTGYGIAEQASGLTVSVRNSAIVGTLSATKAGDQYYIENSQVSGTVSGTSTDFSCLNSWKPPQTAVGAHCT